MKKKKNKAREIEYTNTETLSLSPNPAAPHLDPEYSGRILEEVRTALQVWREAHPFPVSSSQNRSLSPPSSQIKENRKMTEKEKMLRGELYDANYDESLIADRTRCKVLCQKYNNLPIDDFEAREKLIREILGKTGKAVNIEPDFWCDYGWNIEVGENFYANHGLVILDGGGVTFGDNVFIAPSCGFHTAGHPIDYERRNKGLEYAYPIKVGDNVWIGAGVQVMPGVTIGSDVVIGGGSVVTRDIPDHSVAVGNPCRVIRKTREVPQSLPSAALLKG